MTIFDQAWASAVVAACDPVFDAAAAGFVRQTMSDEEGQASALLWEAEPLRFVERFPDRHIEESYGSQWPAPCLDWWVYIEGSNARLSVEGGTDDQVLVLLTGDGQTDGQALADAFTNLLGS